MSDPYKLENGKDWLNKTSINVRIITKDREILIGKIYVSEDERLQDVLNDGRDFLPVFILDGVKHFHEVIRKDDIRRIRHLEDV